MSEHLHLFATETTRTLVSLPHDLNVLIDDWTQLRKALLRKVPQAFTRDEWAYLMTYLGSENLRQPFQRFFGVRQEIISSPFHLLLKARGPCAIWLPNNVSLLGPLILILLSLLGGPVRFKAASRAEDLTTAFIEEIYSQDPGNVLRLYLENCVLIERFPSQDERNAEMAANAQVRIVFGGNEAAQAIDSLPHPVGSIPIAFTDRRSEAWLEPGALTKELLTNLIKVFAVYGQAGCTSPARVMLLEASERDAKALCDQLIALWPQIMPQPPMMHVASANVLVQQWAAACGWDAQTTAHNGAVLAVGKADLPAIRGPMFLPIVYADIDEAVGTMPPNIQTVGYALENPGDPKWFRLITSTAVKRFVPVAQMHHFGPIWDGYAFWRQLFEEIEIA